MEGLVSALCGLREDIMSVDRLARIMEIKVGGQRVGADLYRNFSVLTNLRKGS